jgi:putative membrane protein
MQGIHKYLATFVMGCGIALAVGAADTKDAQDASEEFVKKASMAGLFEIEAAEVALDRSRNADVRAIAEKMIQDHKRSSDKLRNLLTQEKLRFRFSMTLDEAHAEKVRKLKEVRAEGFDKEYLSMQENAHEDTIDVFETFLSAKEPHPALRTYAEETLPTLKMHHERIDGVEEKSQSLLNRARPMRVQVALMRSASPGGTSAYI